MKEDELVERHDSIEQKIQKKISDSGGFHPNTDQGYLDLKKEKEIVSAKIALYHSLSYSPNSGLFPNDVDELTPVDAFSEEHKAQVGKLFDSYDIVVPIDFTKNGFGFDPVGRRMKFSSEGVFGDKRGRLFKISNGITGKKTINGIDHAVIESVLIPLDIALIHEIGHYLYDIDADVYQNLVDAKTKRRAFMGKFHSDLLDQQNIHGSGIINENASRLGFGLPPRHGYFSSGDISGNQVIYEPINSIYKHYDIVGNMDEFLQKKPDRNVPWTSAVRMVSFLAGLKNHASPIKYKHILFSNTRFSTLNNLFESAKGRERQQMIKYAPFGMGSILASYKTYKDERTKVDKKPFNEGFLKALEKKENKEEECVIC